MKLPQNNKNCNIEDMRHVLSSKLIWNGPVPAYKALTLCVSHEDKRNKKKNNSGKLF